MEPFVRRLLEGLATSGLRITLAGSTRPAKSWLDRFGFGFARLPYGSRRSDMAVVLPALLKGSIGLRRSALSSLLGMTDAASLRGPVVRHLLDSGGFDVAYVPWINNLTEHPTILGPLVPVVTSCRGSLITIAPWVPGAEQYRDALRHALDGAALVHCVSREIADEASTLGLDPSKVEVITPAVDVDQFTPSRGVDNEQRTGIRVVAVGSLIWRKSYEHAIAALAAALRSGVDADLTIVGEGPERQRLAFTAWDLGIADRVHLVGARPSTEIVRYLREADVFLHSSCEEGIANSVLEAMACGLPVVTTDAGGMAEAVDDGVEGFVVGVRDSSAMADALIRLAGDADLRETMGSAGRARVEAEFRLDRQVDSFIELFASVVGGGRS